ncbi:flagellar biosynthesis protein FlhA [Mariprofundus micogutta]|uniref:Flagellar biosynthesis protein FlhA n=1 Tax=Mariprofundus micogutta TaxID=1921010 RepID=A0A1L8CKJ2_9PROT|nr:flagellar biosynthesis protein FlhA [Mariprofundus micogutta]GAV19420.1 flagellar biosynthesis protein FlhA [Mariprofundus micogutta]
MQSAAMTLQRIGRQPDVMLAVGVLGILMVMIVPLPPWLMDVLLAANITIGILILLTSIYVLKPLEFSVFPSLLLLTTLFRLSLNVATTRLILLHGQEGPAAAGHVIEGFGEFVVGGNTVVGLIIFIILVLINFVVITKGSTRIAEVAARFTLDAMPGKQMAIDADMNAGLIDEAEARKRRENVAREAEFYGAMDGASKFVRGDAVAGLIITVINLIAGLIIGVMQHGMPASDAMAVFSLLTVGDGLVSQIPALVISIAAGIIITRASSNTALPLELKEQFTKHPKVHFVASGALILMSLVPGLPFVPFLILSLGLAASGYYLQLGQQETALVSDAEDVTPQPEVSPEAALDDLLVEDPIRLEIGYGLIDMVENSREGNLLDRMKKVRRQITQEIGFVLPPVHIKDNLQLGVSDYQILIRGAVVGSGEIRPRNLLALESQMTGPAIEGIPTQEPAFGLPALWISEDKRQQAELSGYTVVEPTTVIITHLTEVLRAQASEMLDRTQVHELLDKFSQRHPKVVDEIVPAQVSVGTLQNVLQRLLSEWVPIRDLMLILEALSDHAGENLSIDDLVEHVRSRLGRTITQRYLNQQGELAVFMLDGELEQRMTERMVQQAGWGLPLEMAEWQRFMARLNEVASQYDVDMPVLLTTPQLRGPLSQALRKIMNRIVVLSINEMPPQTNVQSLARVSLYDAN